MVNEWQSQLAHANFFWFCELLTFILFEPIEWLKIIFKDLYWITILPESKYA